MANLKLGPLPKLGTTKLAVTLQVGLKDELDLYAAEYSRIHGPVEAATLVPHMLEAFLRSDRSWRSRKSGRMKTKVATGKDVPAGRPLSAPRNPEDPSHSDVP